MEAYVNGDNTLQVELQMLEDKLNTLHQYEWESDAEFKERMLNAQADYVDRKKELADAERAIEHAKYQALAGPLPGQMSALIDATGDESRESVMLSKTLALAQVAIQQGVAIAEAIASATPGDPFTAVLRIATAITTVITSFLQATQSINSAKFARGGAIRGAGTSTSDSIPIMASNGEYVMNAKSLRHVRTSYRGDERHGQRHGRAGADLQHLVGREQLRTGRAAAQRRKRQRRSDHRRGGRGD